MSKEIINWGFVSVHLAHSDARQETRVYVTESGSRIRLRHNAHFLNWITNAPRCITISVDRKTEKRSNNRASTRGRVQRRCLRCRGYSFCRNVSCRRRTIDTFSISIDDLAAEAPPVLPVLPTRPRAIEVFSRKSPTRFRFLRDRFRKRPPGRCLMYWCCAGYILAAVTPGDRYP